MTILGPHVFLFSFSSVNLSLANLSLRSLVALAVASSPSLGVSDLGAGSSIISLGSSSIMSGLTFSLTALPFEIVLIKL